MTSDEQTPKIQVDTDWKAEAQAEKERLARQEAEREEQGGNEGWGHRHERKGRERPPW